MPNDSSTGGYLTPSSTNSELNDQALIVALQAVVVGITGMPGNMVRPRWQVSPPNVPDLGVNWVSIGPAERERDPFAAVLHDQTTGTNSKVIRNQVISILCSFYGPAAEANSELFAMGLEIGQNRTAMKQAGLNLVGGAGRAVVVPVQMKQSWVYRIDIPFRIRRQQQYTYSVLDIVKVQSTLMAQAGEQIITEQINVSLPTGDETPQQ
jgi:hypothetical protein